MDNQGHHESGVFALYGFLESRFTSIYTKGGISSFLLEASCLSLYIFATILASNPDIHLLYAGILFVTANYLNRAMQNAVKEHDGVGNLHKLFTLTSRYLSFGIFYSACAISVYRGSGNSIFLLAAVFSFFIWAYLVTFIIRYATIRPELFSDLLGRSNLTIIQDKSVYIWERRFFKIAHTLREGIWSIFLLACGIMEFAGLLYWSSILLLVVYYITIIRLLKYLYPEDSGGVSRSEKFFLFYILGALVLLYLVVRLPFRDVIEVFNVVGPEVLFLILFPAFWAIPYAMTLKILLDNRISFLDALYTQVSGDGFNSVTPLLGMGGEPYKAKHLSKFVSLQDSSRAIIQSRLVHALSGVLLTGLVLLICSIVVDFTNLPGMKIGVIVVMTIMFVVSALLLWVTMSRAPSHLTRFLLTKFRLIEEYSHVSLPWGKMITATAYRLIGRCSKFIELYLIFIVLDINPSFADMVLVQAMILTSVSLFFFIPQGLGVNEAGILAAFELAGYTAATGIVFGLIRRSRMVVYALTGLTVYIVGSYYYARKNRKAAQCAASSD